MTSAEPTRWWSADVISTARNVELEVASLLGDLQLMPDNRGLTYPEALAILKGIEDNIAHAVTAAMHAAHQRGHTLAEIAEATGTSKQNVWNRLDRADRLAPR